VGHPARIDHQRFAGDRAEQRRVIWSLLQGLLSTLALAGAAVSAGPSGPAGQALRSVPHGYPLAHNSSSAPARLANARAAAGAGAAPEAEAAGRIPDDRLLGQRIMVGFSGTTASAALLRSVRVGHVGSVILFAANIGTRSQLRALTGALQKAARTGGNPPLLIAVDQEGGEVKRLPNGPPDLSPPQIARTGSTGVASREGDATGRYLKGLGINWDLAPVVDVPTFPGAFIWTQGRAFSFNAAAVSRYATGFALGLQGAGVAATAKHFPGLGSAPISTDNKLQVLHPTRRQRDQALKPYKTLISRGLDAVLVSIAGFPAYDPSGAPAALSAPIIQGLLRAELHFRGVAITDALGGPTGHDERTAGVLAARAGADILLFTDAADGELGALLRALHGGQISRSQAEASYQRIVALKRTVAGG
jgi:beta-N-acetylhexosaminidase